MLEAQLGSMNMIKPGVKMSEIQNKSFKLLLEGLVRIGVLNGEIEEMFEKQVYFTFMPHSLSHYIGFKTHDVGLQISTDKLTNKDPVEFKESYKKYESVNSAVLEAGMVCTCEPGIYFIPTLVSKSKDDEDIKKYFDFLKLEEYMSVGGVRIEDCVLVTGDGFDCLTRVR